MLVYSFWRYFLGLTCTAVQKLWDYGHLQKWLMHRSQIARQLQHTSHIHCALLLAPPGHAVTQHTDKMVCFFVANPSPAGCCTLHRCRLTCSNNTDVAFGIEIEQLTLSLLQQLQVCNAVERPLPAELISGL